MLKSNSDQRLAWILSTFFFLSALSFIGHHEMWRDELQAWLLARDSQSILALFQNLKYEYHQSLWYLLLYPLTRIFTAPEAMQHLNVSIATAAVYVMARYAPFSQLQKILLAASYFLFFEYALIARNYALTVFFIFLICALFQKRAKHPTLFAAAIFLLCHTSLMGLFFAISLSLTVLFEIKMVWKVARPAKPVRLIGFDWQTTLALFIALMGIGSAVIQLSPPPDLVVGPWKFEPSLAGLKAIMTVIVGAYFPLPSFELHFWRTLFGLSSQLLLIFSLVWAGLMMYLFICFLSKRPASLCLYIVTTTALILFFYAKHLGELRHHGFLFIALISALWIYPVCMPCHQYTWRKFFPVVSHQLASRALNAILVIQLISSSIAVFMDYRFVFSSAKQTAQFVQENKLESAQIIADVSYAVSAVTAYLHNKQFFYPDAQRYGTFIKWDDQRTKSVNLESLVADSQRLALQGNRVILILNQPLEEYKPGLGTKDYKAHFNKIFESTKTILWDEHFSVYEFIPDAVSIQ